MRPSCLSLAALLLLCPVPLWAQAPSGQTAPRFLPNRGQWHPEVQFGALGGTALWVHTDGWTVRFERWQRSSGDAAPAAVASAVVRTRFRRGAATCVGEGAVSGLHHFLRGNDPSRWVTGVGSFWGLGLRGLRPGVDAVLRPLAGPDAAFEYDLHLAPGADLDGLVADLEGVEDLAVDAAGALRAELRLLDGTRLVLVQRPPVAWQEGPSGPEPVAVQFRRLGPRTFGFAARDWNATLPLVIDPGVAWSTLLGGGSSDSINAVRWVPGTGIYLGGWTGSSDFPTTPGAFQGTGQRDAFVARLTEDGSALAFATYLGGSRGEEVRGLAVDAGGAVTVVGFTDSLDFPVTAGAYQGTYGGSSLFLALGDAFVTRLDAAGSSLLGSTYLGGFFDEVGEAVDVDAAGNAVVAGWSSSPDLPTTPGALQPSLGGPVTLQSDGFVARFSPDGRTAHYVTYLGGAGPDHLRAVQLDSQGRATVAGHSLSADFPTSIAAYRTASLGLLEGVAARLDAQGASLVWSTYLGGVGNDQILGLHVAGDGSVLLCGTTTSTNYPTTAGAPQRTRGGGSDAFISRLSNNGDGLPWSTLWGGAGDDHARAVGIGPNGGAFVVGDTTGSFPVTSDAVQSAHGGGSLDGWVSWFNGAGTGVSFSSYLGGAGDDVLGSLSASPSGMVVVGGWSWSADWPVTPGAVQTTRRGVEDGVVLQLDLLTDLSGGLRIARPAGQGDAVFAPGTELAALELDLTNETVRAVELRGLRVYVGGKGDNGDLASLSLWLDPAAGGPIAGMQRLAGPVAPPVEGDEVTFALPGLVLHPAQSVRLVVSIDTATFCPTGAEYQCSVVALDSWDVQAIGAGTGPRLTLLSSPGIIGPVLACTEVIGFPGDDDGDGLFTVSDLRRLVQRLGGLPNVADPDGDGVITLNDLDWLKTRLLGRPIVRSVPSVLLLGSFPTIRGFGLRGGVTTTLGGRVLPRAAETDSEVAFRVDPTLAPGQYELRVQLAERLLVLQQVQVQ